MPAKRSSNTHKSPRKPEHTSALTQPGVVHDLVGVALVVVALALALALLVPSSAPLAAIMASCLRLGFGAGALLVPITLVLFAVTMFMPTDDALVAREALGLSLVVVAILSILSILAPGADTNPSVVLEAQIAAATGGYVGSGVAWVLLTFTGRLIGIVLLVGLGLAGAIVCGFSVSNLVEHLQRSMSAAAHHLAAAREQGGDTRRRDELVDDEDLWDFEQSDDLTECAPSGAKTRRLDAEPATSFIGSRKTSVLRRRGSTNSHLDHATGTLPLQGADSDESAPERPTSLLHRKRHPKLKKSETLTVDNGLSVDNPESQLDPETSEDVPLDAAVQSGAVSSASSKRSRRAKVPRARGKAASSSEELTETASTPAASSSAQPAIPEFLRVVAQDAHPKANQTQQASRRTPSAAVTHTSHSTAQKSSRGTSTHDCKRPGDDAEDFMLPPLSLLDSNPNSASSASSDSELERTARRLQSTLEEFGLTSRVAGRTSGPLVTTFKIEMGEGERVSKITNLQDDIQLSLASESVRIFAPIPGTSLVGIEIPNKKRQNVCLGDVLPEAHGGPLEFAIGRDSEGKPVIADLARMPHMLVAGTTGSGKSVLINAIIMSLIMRTTPDQVRLILVDPKRVEFSCYAGLPHLYVPVVTEPRQAASALQWAVTEMDRRLKVFERAGARDVKVYNSMVKSGKFDDQENPPKPMPYLVIVIDELSDLMMVAGKDVEASIVRIAQLARAAGIHLVLATQRPSADVVTGLIKSNVDTRVALKVSSSIDSRVILDQTGAERLMGRGDMLFRKSGGVLRRILGAYASDPEIESVVTFIRDQREPDYHDEILSAVVPGHAGSGTSSDAQDDDPLVWEAAQVVVDSQLGSTSGLQRRLKVGYARAGRIMDMLEHKGIVGPPDGSKPREVLLDADGLEELRSAEATYREV